LTDSNDGSEELQS